MTEKLERTLRRGKVHRSQIEHLVAKYHDVPMDRVPRRFSMGYSPRWMYVCGVVIAADHGELPERFKRPAYDPDGWWLGWWIDEV